jgi:hypothetical protein
MKFKRARRIFIRVFQVFLEDSTTDASKQAGRWDSEKKKCSTLQRGGSREHGTISESLSSSKLKPRKIWEIPSSRPKGLDAATVEHVSCAVQKTLCTSLRMEVWYFQDG